MTLDSERDESPRVDLIFAPEEHITFSAGEALSGRNGAHFQDIRRQNIEKTRNARNCRPHKTS